MQPDLATPPNRSTLARWTTGFLQLLSISLRRLFRSRQTLVCAMFLFLVSIVVIAVSMRREPTTKQFIEAVFLGVFVSFLLPIYGLCFGAAGIAAEREEKTLVYLLVSPLPRPLVFFAKALAAMILTLLWTLGSLTVLCLAGGAAGREALLPLAPPVIWATIAYVSLFLLFSVQFRRATIIAVAYALFVETLLGNMPGIAKRVALSFYTKCLVLSAGEPFGVSVSGRRSEELFGAIPASAAFYSLLIASTGFLLLGAVLFSRREYSN